MITKTKALSVLSASALAFTLVAVGAPAQAAPVADPIAGWSLRQMVGATFMVGAAFEGDTVNEETGVNEATIALLRDRFVGGIFYHGRSYEPLEHIAELSETYKAAAAIPSRLFISTDQEGGNVRVLQGPGFTNIPSAAAQAHTTTIGREAETWGLELANAGINVNLAPTVDLVDPDWNARDNAPIGYWDRHYGRTATEVIDKGGAFARGMQRAGVIPTLKHFPGLGRVTKNPDSETGVTDYRTTADDNAVRVFTTLANRLSAHYPQPWVMMSTAMYEKIDPGTPVAFSPKVVSIIRDSGFDGIITTDDLANAAQVQAWTPEQRAIRAIEAGVDVVLFSARIDDVPAAMDAVFRRAETVPEFRAKVEAAARRVATAAEHLPVG